MSSLPATWRDRWRRYAQDYLRDDLLAACIVSVLLIPQSLAYAMLAGLPPQAGLYASLLPLLAYAALGSSPFLSVGPVAMLALMIAQALAQAPADVGAADASLVLAAEVGVVLALAALLRLDALASLLSAPVLHGFETGATLSIAASQLPGLVGSPAHGFEWPELLRSAIASHGAWRPWTLMFGGTALLLLLLARAGLPGLLRRWLRAPLAAALARLAPLLVLLAAMALAHTGQVQLRGVALVGALPTLSLPLTAPPLDARLWAAMLPGALMLALLAYVSSLAVAESLARRRAQRILPRRELWGLAGANLLASISGGMPVAGSFSRSVLLFDAGGRTRMCIAFIAMLMGLALLVLAEALAWLPRSVLAATIIVAVLSGLRPGPFAQAWRYDRGEALLMLAVAVLVLTQGISVALGLGVLGSIALLLKRTAQPHVALVGRVPGTEHYRNVDRHRVECHPEALGLRIDESMLFTNVRGLPDVVQAHLDQHPQTRRVVLLMSPVNSIDFSGLEALHDLHDALARQRIRLDLSEVKGPVLDRLKAGGWEQWFRGQVYLSHHQGMQAPHAD
ncbi:MAG: STAS domain-containing protein [Burkholderiaceae bacterium]|nr:STAS domain-containing protein [Roseateles sp.]MBV8470061.1 STAS domain-containing protein [Burkholderiaceae bacterium]